MALIPKEWKDGWKTSFSEVPPTPDKWVEAVLPLFGQNNLISKIRPKYQTSTLIQKKDFTREKKKRKETPGP